MKKSNYKIVLIFIGIIILTIFFIRLFNSKELDDVTPGISCEPGLLEKSDVLWVIPNYNNFSISENKEFCSYILNMNKTLGMHGVTHEYNEFGTDRQQEYLDKGVDMFNNCFNKNPEMFKPPQLKISLENKKLIKENGIKLKWKINQVLHKVYHCNDAGKVKNSVIDLF